jgi:hypothetical protein
MRGLEKEYLEHRILDAIEFIPMSKGAICDLLYGNEDGYYAVDLAIKRMRKRGYVKFHFCRWVITNKGIGALNKMYRCVFAVR